MLPSQRARANDRSRHRCRTVYVFICSCCRRVFDVRPGDNCPACGRWHGVVWPLRRVKD